MTTLVESATRRQRTELFALRRSDSVAVRRNVTAASDPDLFFGLRGAGGALGVVISFSTLSFPIPPVVSGRLYLACAMHRAWPGSRSTLSASPRCPSMHADAGMQSML
jgi:hypothetical protein